VKDTGVAISLVRGRRCAAEKWVMRGR
jgi:hypothetical protein